MGKNTGRKFMKKWNGGSICGLSEDEWNRMKELQRKYNTMKFNMIREEIIKPEKYDGPIAIDMKVSKELDDYHKNYVIQINTHDA
jgi:hypothetical protein